MTRSFPSPTGSAVATTTVTVVAVLGLLVGPAVAAPAADTAASTHCVLEKTDEDFSMYGVPGTGVLTPHAEQDDLLVLLGGFTDTDPTYSASDFENAFFGTGTADVNGTGTLRDYYLEATDGMVDLSSGPAGVSGWYETDMSTDQIIDDDGELDLTPRDNHQFVRKVVDQADEDVDFSDYDTDGDGCIGVVVVYQEARFRAHAATAWGDFFTDGNFALEVDGVTIGAYARVQELHDRTDDRNAIGTPAHEIGHLYGLPDLYQENGNGGIGLWGLMGTGNFGNRSGEREKTSPTHFSAWSKLQLLSHPSPGVDRRSDYRTVIAPSGRPGILPAAANHTAYYRIDPENVEGCDPCEDQYYLLGYRKQVGFDRGLERGTWSNSLRIWRLDGWNGTMTNHWAMIDGVNRIHGYGNQSFNASTENLARLADGRDSGLDLREFEQQFGVATFNDPPVRHLDPDEEAVFAVAVATTLPDGTEVGQDYVVENRVAPEDPNAELGVHLSATSYTDDSTGRQFVRAEVPQRGLGDGVVEEGAKLVHTTNRSTDYLSATTYPTYPLPSNATATVTDFDPADATVTIDVAVTHAGEPYEYGAFGAPDADHFAVEIGGARVPSEDLSLTERAEHDYVLEAPVPTEEARGYDLTVAFTDEKAGVDHTVTGADNLMAPVFDTMSGDGTEADPYEVTDASHLQALDADRTAAFELGADVDASPTASWFDGSGFGPVAAAEGTAFEGRLDGNGHTISGLTIDRGDQPTVGLFGALGSDATVRDLTIADATVTGGERTGVLAGRNHGAIRNVTVQDVRVAGGRQTGGLVGHNNGTIHDATVSGAVAGGRNTGGLVGQNLGPADEPSVYRAAASADVTGDHSAGGLVGYNNGLLEEVFATGTVEGGEIVGGLVGYNYDGTIRRAYATGDVRGERRVGGLVGELQDAASTPEGGRLIESYAAGSVTATEELAGGLVATTTLGEIERSYFDSEATGQDRAIGSRTEDELLAAPGLDTADMRGSAAEDAMAEFDFASTWRVAPDGYPEFQWEDGEEASTASTAVGESGTETDGADGDDEQGTSSGGGDSRTERAATDAVDVSQPGFGGWSAVLALALFVVATSLGSRDEDR